jgi:cytokinin dehydrogenase
MSEELMSDSRRDFLKRFVAGALVLGFDLRGRSWVTRAAADGGIAALPRLDGELRIAGLEPYAADFGRIVSRRPRAVLAPGSVEDIVTIVRFARVHRLHVAANGQSGTNDMRESHSNFGQSQVEAGVAIDMSSLDAISIGEGPHADVGAGAHWAEVFDAAVAQGLTPPVFTDYVHLSVGGTLSVGGIGGSSQFFGVQADNVSELDVVTGRGERERCSPHHNRELFDAVLAGAGQCAIIVGAKLRLVPAETQARVFLLFYDDLDRYLADQLALLRDGRFRHLEGQVVRRADDRGWRFMIEAASYFTPPRSPDDSALLAGLHDNRAEAQISTSSCRDFIFRLDPTVAFLKSIGVWQLPHPWISLFLPAARTSAYVSSVLSHPDPGGHRTGADPALSVRHGEDDAAAIPGARAPACLSPQRATDRGAARRRGRGGHAGGQPDAVRSRGRGGRCPLRHRRDPRVLAARLATTLRRCVGFLARAKQRFDPDRVLTPGQGMFGD